MCKIPIGGVGLKKINTLLGGFVLALLITVNSPVDALRLPDPVLTLDNIREMTIQHTIQTEPYAKVLNELEEDKKRYQTEPFEIKNYSYDFSGNETVIYPGNNEPYDYEEKINDYEEQYQDIIKNNEKKAIDLYGQILQKQLDIDRKALEIEMATDRLKVAEISLSLGQIYPTQLESSKVALEILQNDLSVLNSDLNLLYIELNELVGFPSDSRYALTMDSLIEKVELGTEILYVPSKALDYVLINSDEFRSLMEEKEEIENKLERLETFYEQDSYIYETQKKKLGLPNLEISIDSQTYNQEIFLKQKLQDINISLLELSSEYEDMNHIKYLTDLQRIKHEVGTISKIDFSQSRMDLIQRQKEYISNAIAVHDEMLDYELLYE